MPAPNDSARAERNRRIVIQHRRIADIIESVSARLPPENLESARGYLAGGEYGYAFDGILAALVRLRIPVTVAEYRAITDAASFYSQPSKTLPFTGPDTLAALTVADPPESGSSGRSN